METLDQRKHRTVQLCTEAPKNHTLEHNLADVLAAPDVPLQDILLLFRCACQLRDPTRPHFTPQHWLLCHMGLY